MEEGGLPANKGSRCKGEEIMHLCEMKTKTKSNRFKMLKLVHKSKFNKFHGGNRPAEVALADKTRRRAHGVEEQWLFALQICNTMRRDVGSKTSRR